MNAFAKSLELSSRAASRTGPKMRKPAARNASTMPSASSASGPTIVSPIDSRCANATSVGIVSSGTLTRSGSDAVPALPGATNTFATRGDCATFHASACSRPPPPTTSTFIGRSMPEMAHAGEHHRNAALVGRRDHLVVAYAAAGLDDRDRAVIGNDVEAVAKGKERIGRHHRAGKRQLRVPRLDGREARRVDATHLARADAECTERLAIDDRVRLDEPRDSPGEEQVGDLLGGRRRLRHDAQVARAHLPIVGALHEQA